MDRFSIVDGHDRHANVMFESIHFIGEETVLGHERFIDIEIGKNLDLIQYPFAKFVGNHIFLMQEAVHPNAHHYAFGCGIQMHIRGPFGYGVLDN